MEKLIILIPTTSLLIIGIICFNKWIWPDISSITKLKIKRICNFILGLSIIIIFFIIDFLISASPSLFIRPRNMFENLICLTLFVIIFIIIIILSINFYSKLKKPKTKNT